MAIFFINVIRGDSADRGDSSSEQRGRARRRAPGAPPCPSSLTWATNRSTTASILHPREDQYDPQVVWRRSSLVNRSNRLGVLLHGCMHDALASVASELACAYIYTHLHGRKPTTPSVMESTKTPDSQESSIYAYTSTQKHTCKPSDRAEEVKMTCLFAEKANKIRSMYTCIYICTDASQ